jgi:hypothetical protein
MQAVVSVSNCMVTIVSIQIVCPVLSALLRQKKHNLGD